MGYFDSFYADDRLPSRAKAVYLYLRSRANKDGVCWPAIGTIARELNLSRSTVKRALRDLEELDYVENYKRFRRNGGSTSNFYLIARNGLIKK